MSDDARNTDLSIIREHLGWLIGKRIVDVTANDPFALPDSEPEDGAFIILHFDNGGTFVVPVGDDGVAYENPDDSEGEVGIQPS